MHTAAPEWMINGHRNQIQLDRPETWVLIGGRGSGKTRTGAEWINGLALGYAPMAALKTGPLALVGETIADVREVMVEGPAGILASARAGRPRFEPSRRRLVWDATGMVAHMFSSEDPESLRGPQFAGAWCDELAKWKNAEETWNMLQFGLRIGERPRVLVTTTPRPVPLLKRLIADPAVTVTRIRTDENASNLAPQFLNNMRRQFAGTRLGRQELDGELIEDRDDALWSRGQIESLRGNAPSHIGRTIIAVDPPASATKNADACGIIAIGLDDQGIAHVLADGSIKQASPQAWATRAVQLYHELKADRIIAEINQGGDMVETVIRTIDPLVPVTGVRAQRGKWLRAEPVAALYEQGRVRHAGHFPHLEDEMCNFGRDGLANGHSPDRIDALVWAITALMLAKREAPRVRQL
jgi:phage terminase large subunit-like protein